MSCILRIDDFPGTKPEEFWRHNLDNFKRFDAVLEKHGIQSYVLGVIPKHTTESHIEWLASNPRVDVALHGIQHDERFPNEFQFYETEEDIYRKIVSAIQPLKACNGDGEITKYIPPHNVIDVKTCNALRRAGFDTVLCGPGTTPEMMSSMKNLRDPHIRVIHSYHPHFYGRTDEMMDRDGAIPVILDDAQSAAHRALTLHWTWEWNIGLDNLDRFLSKVGHVIIG